MGQANHPHEVHGSPVSGIRPHGPVRGPAESNKPADRLADEVDLKSFWNAMSQDPSLAHNHLLRDALGDLAHREDRTPFIPDADVFTDDESVCFFIDLPGVRPNDISIELREGYLRLTGERRASILPPSLADKAVCLQKELSVGCFFKTFHLAEDIDIDRVESFYQQGVLMLRLYRFRRQH